MNLVLTKHEKTPSTFDGKKGQFWQYFPKLPNQYCLVWNRYLELGAYLSIPSDSGTRRVATAGSNKFQKGGPHLLLLKDKQTSLFF